MISTAQWSRTCFRWVHGRHLVYNTCWEDPRLDRAALHLSRSDDVLVITSAGCNALDYALSGPNRVYAVDINPLQNALLELKLAAIRQLDFEPFFEMFGRGRCPDWDRVYAQQLRPALSSAAQHIWDRRGRLFASRGRRTFYFRGSSGQFAWMVNGYINRIARLRDAVDDLLQTRKLSEQQEVFERHQIQRTLFRPLVKWCLRRDVTLSLLGVPRSQRQQVDRDYPGGIAQFAEDRVAAVFTQRLLCENYFYRVYLTGEYLPDCCPGYLQPDNFQRLKEGLVDTVQVVTASVDGFLRDYRGTISRFVLLDHMDWLYSNQPDVLQAEWQAIVDRAAPDARILWRSAGLQVEFVDPIPVTVEGRCAHMGELLTYDEQLASALHATDRVNTYGSFYIADLSA